MAHPSSLGTNKIAHVIVVILENRSFDNLFHFYDHAKADVQDYGYDHNGNKVMLLPRSFTETTDADHSHVGFVKQYDGGKNDGWDLTSESATKPDYPYGYLPKSEIQPYLDLANESAISDRFFHGVQAPTFPSHVELGAATTLGVVDNPSVSIPWGCDAAPGTTTGILAADGSVDEKGPFPCFDQLSVFDLLDRKGVGWKYYDEPTGLSVTGNLNIPEIFRQIRYGDDWNTKIDLNDKDIDTDITSGALPQVSYVIPDETSTDHAGTPSLGPTYIANLANLLGNSSYYQNTVMIVTWDDWGGWYDHVVPKILDSTSLSYRKPIIFIGAYVKHGYVSHVPTEDASIIRYLEDLFNLGTLGRHDLRTVGFEDVFDFSQTPPAYQTVNPVITYSPTSNSPNFRVRPAAILGRHDGKDYWGERAGDY